jgi:hypothetical protein
MEFDSNEYLVYPRGHEVRVVVTRDMVPIDKRDFTPAQARAHAQQLKERVEAARQRGDHDVVLLLARGAYRLPNSAALTIIDRLEAVAISAAPAFAA